MKYVDYTMPSLHKYCTILFELEITLKPYQTRKFVFGYQYYHSLFMLLRISTWYTYTLHLKVFILWHILSHMSGIGGELMFMCILDLLYVYLNCIK